MQVGGDASCVDKLWLPWKDLLFLFASHSLIFACVCTFGPPLCLNGLPTLPPNFHQDPMASAPQRKSLDTPPQWLNRFGAAEADLIQAKVRFCVS